MTIYKTVNGYFRISDIIAGHWVSRLYIGYRKREAIRLFREEARNEAG